MYKKVLLLIFVFTLSFLSIIDVNAKNKVDVYFFHGRGCPHCADEEKYLEQVKKKYSNVNIKEYEVWYDSDNAELLSKVKDALDVESNGVPFTVISNVGTVGYNDAIGRKLDRLIEYYSTNKSIDAIKLVKEGKEVPKNEEDVLKKEDDSTTFTFPFIGEIKAKNLSLTTAAIAIALVDGFNPCAMWVLIFLISILVSMKNRKRMWYIGFTFLFTSAVCYFLILLFWSSITKLINNFNPVYLKLIIAVVALIGAFINIKAFITTDEDGCTVVNDKKRKPILERVKKYTTAKSFKVAILGTALLAVSVNLIELACSAGLPAMFTGLLGMNNLTRFGEIKYLLIYTIFFMLDDIIIFLIAMKTMKVAAISTKYNKYSHLIGGLIMLIIGALVILKPEWLMFNFK